jgi:cation/acetate symporter
VWAAAVAVIIAGYFGINPPGFVAAVVALYFWIAAASLFPAIITWVLTRNEQRRRYSRYDYRFLIDAFYMLKFKFGLLMWWNALLLA